MTGAVLARERELAAIEGFLDAFPATTGALLVSGPPGIGKTTLWEQALAAARRRSIRVVTSRPTEVETGLAFAGLNDLLGEIADDALPLLSEPQRVALEAALMRVAADAPPQPLAVSLAVLSVLRSAAERQHLLLAVDDAPWLDEPSVRVLEFALRRLQGEPIGVIAAQRATGDEPPIPLLLRGVPSSRLNRIAVGGLSVDATDALLRSRLGLDLSRPALVRLHSVADGNPFYALELGRAVQRGGRAGALDPLAVPHSLDRLVGERLDALAGDAADVALFAAAAAQPTTRLLDAALGSAASLGISALRGAGVLEIDGESVRFSHPLLAAAAYGRASVDARRGAHARLAAVVGDAEERAKHLATAATEPDEGVAAALEAAATVVARRGAPDAGADLAERAADLTPDAEQPSRRRRLFLAAEQHLVAGDSGRARRLLQRLVDEPADAPETAEALARLAHLLLVQAEWDEAEILFRRAAELVDDAPRRRIPIEHGLAGVAYLTWRNWPAAAVHDTEALRLAEQLGDPVVLFQMLGYTATTSNTVGGEWRQLMERADALAEWSSEVPSIEHPDVQFVRLLIADGDLEEARARLDRLIGYARARGDWHSMPRLLTESVPIELRAGDLDRAESDLAAAETGMLQTGQGAWMYNAHVAGFEVRVLRGDVEGARAIGSELWRELDARPAMAWERWSASMTAALLELLVGDARAALLFLAPYVRDPASHPFPAAARTRVVALGVDVLVALGRTREARGLLDPWRERGLGSAVRWIAAETEQADAVVLAAEGELDAALAAVERAIELAERTGMPFVLGRALLAAGEIRRRARRKAQAREALERAVDVFTRVGAGLFLDRAQSELARVAVRRPEGSELTETEERIVALVAAGATNREIADALFMSTHTVEAHLGRVFRRLGVHTRTELARHAFQSGDLHNTPPRQAEEPARDGDRA